MGQSRIGGKLIPPGTESTNVIGGKSYTPAASYPSSSSSKTYTVCEVNDGTTSCDCMGWTRRNPPSGRTCRHTEDYEAFLRADWNAMNDGRPVQQPRTPVAAAASSPRPKDEGGSLGDLFEKLSKEGL
jgi:hypothetical protein